MNIDDFPDAEFDRPAIYHFRVRGVLETGQAAYWFPGYKVRAIGSDESLLMGMVADQAALHGLLGRIRDLGLPLISIERIDEDAEKGAWDE